MNLFGGLYDKVMGWSRHRHAPRYLAVVSFVESIFFPIPTAIMLLPMTLAQTSKAWKLAALATVFSVLGGIVGYWLGYAVYGTFEPMLSGHADKLQQAREWFGEYGVWIVLMAGFSPVPYKIFTLTAGSLAMAFIPFVIASIIGRASQFFLIAALAYFLGPTMEPKIRQYVEWLGWLVVALVVGLLIYLNMHK